MLNVIELSGSYHEIGRGWGAALGPDMERVFAIELGTVAALLGVDHEAVVGIGTQYQAAARAYDPDFMTMLQGFAQGAGVDFDTLFALRVVLETLFQTRRPEGMCTAFAVDGSATASGEPLMGQNIDWHPGLPMVLLDITWPGGVRQLALSMAGIWEYTLTAPPDSPPFGLAAALTATHTPCAVTVPVSVVMHKSARQSEMTAAVDTFRQASLNLGSFLLADAGGRQVGIENGLGRHALLEPEQGVLVHANHLVADSLREQDIFLPYVPDSPLRQARLYGLIRKEHGSLTPARMMAFLADHDNHPKSLCAHVDPTSDLPPSATVASVVMEPARLTMHVAVGNPCENEYVAYTLDTDRSTGNLE